MAECPAITNATSCATRSNHDGAAAAFDAHSVANPSRFRR